MNAWLCSHVQSVVFALSPEQEAEARVVIAQRRYLSKKFYVGSHGMTIARCYRKTGGV
jgi:hypothetical protein